MTVVLLHKFHYNFSRNPINRRYHTRRALVPHLATGFCFSFARTLANIRSGPVAVEILLHRIFPQLVALGFDKPYPLRFFQFFLPVQKHSFRREEPIIFVESEPMDLIQVGPQIGYGPEEPVAVIFGAGYPVVGRILCCLDVMTFLQMLISVAVRRVGLVTQVAIENFLGC